MCYNENSASWKQPKTTRNTNIREAKLITWLKEPNKTTTKTCWMKTSKTLLHSGENWKVYIFPTKQKKKITSMTFKVNKEEISNKESIANGFGQIFSSIAIRLLQTLHPIKDFVWNKLTNLPIQTTQKFSFHSVTPSEICKCLRKLWHKKAHRIDELPPNLLKDVTNKISKPLPFIINKSLSSGIVPDLWKISKVTPLYKLDS